MSKEEYLNWATVVVANSQHDKEQAEAFARKLEQADKEAAALLRKVNSAVEDLLGHLVGVVSNQGG